MENKNQQNNQFDVVIVGSGAAGVAAARKLVQVNPQIKYIILEAQDKPGGRLCTQDGVDLGASWIHQWNHQKNPIRKLVEELNQYVYTENPDYEEEYYDIENLQRIEEKLVEKVANFFEELIEISDKKAEQLKTDISFMENIQSEYDQFLRENPDPTIKRLLEQIVAQYQNHEAGKLNELSAKMGLGSVQYEQEESQSCLEKIKQLLYNNHEQKSSKDVEDKIPKGGFGSLLQKASENLNIKLNSAVTKINYSSIDRSQNANEKSLNYSILVDNINQDLSSNQSEYKASYVIVTASINVLKSKVIVFEPELPKEKIEAMNRLQLGQANKVVLEFKNNFWNKDLSAISIASNQPGRFPIFYNLKQHTNRNLLLALITDDFAIESEGMEKEQLVEEAVSKLKRVFMANNSKLTDTDFELENSWVTRWKSNRYIQGSYTFFPTGSTIQDCSLLTDPANSNTLYFAGEACHADFLGTVNAAYYTGEQAAVQIYEEILSNRE